MQNHNDILISCHMFTSELSPEVLVNISFYSNQFYQYFLQIPDGYFINHLLKRRVSHGKRYIFRELGNVSLRKIMDYCYTYTTSRCIGLILLADAKRCCYYCTVIDYAKEEVRNRRISDPDICSILHDGKRECKCLAFCSNNDIIFIMISCNFFRLKI